MQPRKVRILADLGSLLPTTRRGWALGSLVATSMLGVVAATAVAPGVVQPPITPARVVEQITGGTAVVDTPSDLPFVYHEQVRPGDTIQSIFRRIGANDPEAQEFLNQADGRTAQRQLRAGRSLLAVVGSDGRIASLSLPVLGGDSRYTIERTPEGLRARTEDPGAMATFVEMRSGEIRQTLFGATEAAGIPDEVASKLAEIFGTDIDFTADLRRGDRFSVIYETVYDRGIPVRAGRILAAEFVNQGNAYSVVLHRDAEGGDAYYTPEGRSLNQAFLRYPLEFTRISSGFGGRMHPIHKSWRAHKGTDFAAPRGTPVKAASNGVVEFAGNQSGYGNIVVLQHQENHETAYGHLDSFASGLRKGAKVRQGDVIGYVGSTGWATGNHLHYEIRIGGVAKDPLAIALPTARPLDGKALAEFRATTKPYLERLALLAHNRVASAD